MIKKYSRNLKRYFKDIAVTLTNDFIRNNQKFLKRIVRGILKPFKSMKVVPKVIKNECRVQKTKGQNFFLKYIKKDLNLLGASESELVKTIKKL